MPEEIPTYIDSADGTLWGSPAGGQKSEVRSQPDIRPQTSDLRPLPSGSSAAGEVAARISGNRKHRILELLQQRGPLTLWEIAEAMSVQVNQISGRLSELKFDGLITTTGLRKHPVSGILCDVYVISVPSSSSATSAVKPSSLSQRTRP